MSRSYAQIRSKSLEVLRSGYHRGQFTEFLQAVDVAFAEENMPQPHKVGRFGTHEELSDVEKTRFVEVFWDLFREGVITLGINDSEPNFPWFRVTTRGRKRLETTE